jgi:DNA-binding LacI/PurR family transcriptional regulator
MAVSRTRPFHAPTLEHVAQVAGVSRATVSRVINGVSSVDPKLTETVRQAIDETGYVPNRAARALVTRRTDSIALVVSEAENRPFDDPFVGRVFTDPFFRRFVNGIMRLLRPRGVHMVLMLAETTESRAQLASYLGQGHVDGVILISTDANDPLPALLTDRALPAVMAARPARPIPISYVDIEQQTGARLAADHLVARGCQRIGTIAGPLDMPAGQDRLAGFRAAMALHGHAYVPAVEGTFTQDSGDAAMRKLLADEPELDGVFVANDLMAQGAVTALHDLGKRVPEDVAVIGFDDSSAARACRPPLTTIHQPVEDMAAEMARLLLRHIDDPDQRVTSAIFQPRLVVRESA